MTCIHYTTLAARGSKDNQILLRTCKLYHSCIGYCMFVCVCVETLTQEAELREFCG